MRQLADALASHDARLDYSVERLTTLDSDAAGRGADENPSVAAYLGEVILRECWSGSWVARHPQWPERPCLRFGKWYSDPTEIMERVSRDRAQGASVVATAEQ